MNAGFEDTGQPLLKSVPYSHALIGAAAFFLSRAAAVVHAACGGDLPGQMIDIQLKRVYQEPDSSDGKRMLVERLWPRGLTKDKAQVDLWLKEIAPTTELRKWFDHEPAKWTEFKKRYSAELAQNDEQLAQLKKEISTHKATLVYGAKDEEHNAALVLLAFLKKKV